MMFTNIWYAAESSENVDEEPVLVRMLGRDFVLFRDAEGRPACLSNVCPHRGSSLARGKCEDGQISCPFHGWTFNHEGGCTKIPSQENPTRDIPPGAKVDSYPTQEKYGLIWVFLGDDVENALPIYDMPEYDDPNWRHAQYSDTWNANLHWSKMTDLDHVHLPIVHGIGFGGENPVRPPDHTVELLDNGFRTEIRGHTPPMARSFKAYQGKRVAGVVSKLAFYIPGFTLRGEVEFAGAGSGVFNLFYEISTPIDEETTRVFYIFFRNFMMEPEHDAMHVERNLKNIFQDKANAETVMPKRAPDLDDWPIVQADREDRVMSAYWQLMRQLRREGRQIDRVQLDALDKDGDYRVIPSPARRQNADGWVFDVVPTIEPGRGEKSSVTNRSIQGVA